MNESLSNGFRASADQGLDHSVPISETGAVDLAASERRALEERIAELTAANAATDRALQRLSEDNHTRRFRPQPAARDD